MSFYRNRPTTLVEILERVWKCIDILEFLKSKRLGFAEDESTKAKRKHENFERGPRKKLK